jgi:CheY-like chemotaxis protein
LLVDVSVSGIDGAELCRWIRQDDKMQGCAVMVTTASLSSQEQAKLSKAGATGFLGRDADNVVFRDLFAEYLSPRAGSVGDAS